MRRSIVLAFTTAFLLKMTFAQQTLAQQTLAQSPPQTLPFTDTANTWAADCIQDLATKQIINGYGDRTFRPNNQVSRAEFATMLQKAFPGSAQRTAPTFRDVPNEYWAANAIRATAERGFLSGYPDGSFRPTAPIQRVEVVVSLGSGLPISSARDPAEVLSKSLYDWGYVPQYARIPLAAAIVNNRLVSYPSPTLLRPSAAASRADVAALICQTQSVSSAQPAAQPAIVLSQYVAQMMSSPTALPGGIQLSRVFYNLALERYPQNTVNLALTGLGGMAVSEDSNTIAIVGAGMGDALPRFTLLNASTGAVRWSQTLSEKGEFPIFLRNNQVIVGTPKGVEVWNMANRRRQSLFNAIPSGIGGMALSADGRYLTVGSGLQVSVWDLQSGLQVRSWQVEPSENGVLLVAMSKAANGQPLVVAALGQKVQIWNVSTGARVQEVTPQLGDFVRALAISPDGKWLVATAFGQGAELWDLANNRKDRTLATNSDAQVMQFSPDGRYLAMGYPAQYHGDAGEGLMSIDSLQLWELKGSGRLVGSWQAHGDIVRAIAFSANSRTLFSASWEGMVKAWSIPDPLIENPTP